MLTVVHDCKHNAIADAATFSKYLTSMEREAHPLKEPINCVHSYLNLYKSMCTCVYMYIGRFTLFFVFHNLFMNASLMYMNEQLIAQQSLHQ